MAKIIWLTDMHYVTEGTLQGHDPRKRIAAAVDHVNLHHGDADLVMISGDMVENGTPEEYAGLRPMLDRLTLPYVPMMGNHDARAAFMAALPMPPDQLDGFAQYGVDVGGVRVLCLDTVNGESGDGEMCADRLDWLRAALDAAGDRPVLVFMHHPPCDLGLPMLDMIKLRNGDAVLDILVASGAVRHLFAGHVHRSVTGTIRGIPFATMRGVLSQSPPPRPAWTWDSFVPAHEAPAYGVIEVAGGDVRVQLTEFAPAGFAVEA